MSQLTILQSCPAYLWQMKFVLVTFVEFLPNNYFCQIALDSDCWYSLFQKIFVVFP